MRNNVRLCVNVWVLFSIYYRYMRPTIQFEWAYMNRITKGHCDLNVCPQADKWNFVWPMRHGSYLFSYIWQIDIFFVTHFNHSEKVCRWFHCQDEVRRMGCSVVTFKVKSRFLIMVGLCLTIWHILYGRCWIVVYEIYITHDYDMSNLSSNCFPSLQRPTCIFEPGINAFTTIYINICKQIHPLTPYHSLPLLPDKWPAGL